MSATRPGNKNDNNRPLARARRALTLVVFAATFWGTARAACDDPFICIRAEDGGREIRLLAENLSEFPLTYTLRARTRNIDVEGRRTVTRTLAPGETALAMRLLRNGADHEGRYRYWYDWTVGDRHAEHDNDHVYRLPYASGRTYYVLQGYGSRFSHTGLEQFAIDFYMDEGTPVHAARGGVVAKVEESNSIGCWEDGCGRYANYVVVLHDDGTTGEYYHLQKDGALVEVGERVVAGQQIALSGNTGHTTVPHLHFAVYRAVEWGNTQSIPVRFATSEGIIDRPRRGARYRAGPIRQARADSGAESPSPSAWTN